MKKYNYHRGFLKKLDREKCYYLGWILTDGYVDEKKGYIILSIIDREIVEKFRDLICPEIKIWTDKPRKKHYNKSHTLQICSKEAVEDIIKLGIRGNKTFNAVLPKIPDEYFYDFLRGVIEGDGCIFVRKRGPKNCNLGISLCSASFELISQIKNKTNHTGKLGTNIKNRKNPLYTICWHGQKAENICELIYKNAKDFKLNRKYQKYVEYKEFKNG